MKFEQLYSSSTGNLYLVTANNGKRLMIECGVTWAKLQEALNYELSDIVGCLLTHEHADHSKAVKDVRQAGIEVYASVGTFEALGITGRRINAVKDKTLLRLDGFQIYFFDTNHDAAEPLGFIVRADNEFLLFATDTSHIRQQFKHPFSIIAIECSYNKEYLAKRVEEGTINESLAKRLLRSHMEEKVAMRYVEKFCDLNECREIHLLHMSADNLHKDRIKKEFEKHFFLETKIIGGKR